MSCVVTIKKVVHQWELTELGSSMEEQIRDVERELLKEVIDAISTNSVSEVRHLPEGAVEVTLKVSCPIFMEVT